MTIGLAVILILAALFIAAAVRANYELHHLQSAFYSVESEKIAKEDGLRIVFLSDLHSRTYGNNNEDLLKRIADENPDLILSAGDMITSSKEPDLASAAALFREILKIAPVYMAYGNHEKRMSEDTGKIGEDFRQFQKEMADAGICWLLNSGVDINRSISVYGLDIERRYYKKVKRIFYPTEQMKQDLASVREECFNIVLAHNPRFFKTYVEYGADLYLSGHYHGGAVRIGRRIGVISPQFRPFPRYSRGLYRKENTTMIVSAGCGSHKVNLRLFNKPEIVVIDIHGHIL